MARGLGWRPVGIALVVQNEHGELMMIGSKKIESFEVELRADLPDFGSYSRRYVPRQSLRIEAECYDGVMFRSQAMTAQPAIEQRGIYLPDMSFRALPEPEEQRNA